MPSIQLDKILENISLERALYKNEKKTKEAEEAAWKRVASNNNITLHEAKAIYNVLIRKYTTEKAKGNSTWKMFDIMENIQEGHFEEPEKEKDENEGMIELMEVFEEEDSASDKDSELDKSNGSSGSKTSGISTRSGGSSSNKGSPESGQKKLLNTNMIPTASTTTTTPVSQKSSVFIPPNFQKVNLKPIGGSIKKETTGKRRGDQIPASNAAIVKRPAVMAGNHKSSAHTKSPIKQEEPSPPPQRIEEEPKVTIKSEPTSNGYPETPETEDYEMKLPPNFFKNLCSSNRYEAFGLYVANLLNRMDKQSANKLEFRLLQTITQHQSENDN